MEFSIRAVHGPTRSAGTSVSPPSSAWRRHRDARGSSRADPRTRPSPQHHRSSRRHPAPISARSPSEDRGEVDSRRPYNAWRRTSVAGSRSTISTTRGTKRSPTSNETWTVAQGRIPFLNWKMPAPWSSVTNGSQDAWIAQRADAFKSFGSPVYLTLHHEPENDMAQYGSQSDFVAAFRHIVDIFRARGVTNVGWVWTMMAWTCLITIPVRTSTGGTSATELRRLRGCGRIELSPGRPTPWISFNDVFDLPRAFACHTASRG